MLGLVLVRKAGVKTYIVVSSITPSICVFRGCGRGQVMMAPRMTQRSDDRRRSRCEGKNCGGSVPAVTNLKGLVSLSSLSDMAAAVICLRVFD